MAMTRAAGIVGAVALVGVSCGVSSTDATSSSTSTTPSTSTTSLPPSPLPPHELEALAQVFDPIVAPHGYRVTRAALIVRATYATDPAGDHLALYVAPINDISDDRIAADLVPLLADIVPGAFARWSGLVSFDLCQEPFGSEAATPAADTLVDVTRAAASEVEWASLDLAGLIARGQDVVGLAVWARPGGVRESATWQSALTDAGSTVGP